MDRRVEAETLLELALKRPPEEREAFLDAGCGSADLRREVAALLPYVDGDPAFLQSPVPRPRLPDMGELAGAGDRAAAAMCGLPERIGGYRVVRLLGYGGMGMIYEARQSNPDRAVALKLLYPGPVTPDLRRRFAMEGQLLSRLQSPGIAQIFAAGVEEMVDPSGRVYPLPFMAMELVEGERLDAYAARPGLSLADRLRVFAKICDAVDHAHRRGIIHRDLKPANILVTADGQPKILDFGIARLLATVADPSPRLTPTGQILGSLAYMSPERLSGDPRQADIGSDVYALGVILYEMLAGRLPFDVRQLSVAGAAALIQGTAAPRLGTLDRRLQGDLSILVAEAIEKDPQCRYRSAAELAADVRRYLDGLPIRARAASPAYRLAKLVRRHRVLVAAGLAILSVFAAGAGVTAYLARDHGRLSARVERLAYRSGIQAAINALEEDDYPLAREELLAPDLPAPLHGWEWRFLWSRVQAPPVPAPAGVGPQPSWVLRGHADSVEALAFDPAGDSLASASADGVTVLWDPRTYDEIVRLPGPAGDPRSLAFSDDGSRLLSAAGGETSVWDLDTGSRQAGPPPPPPAPLSVPAALRGRARKTLAVAVSPDGRRLATGGRDGRVQLWDASTFEEMARWRGHERGVQALAWSPDGTALASASWDGTVRLWDTVPLAERLAARERQRRDRAGAERLIDALLRATPDLGAVAARLRRDPALGGDLRREALRETLRRAIRKNLRNP